ncbi:MAG: hypothetical protein F6K30_24900, partial [Cyanothece sp. SIO2G6]|nr:hypothetical protein [Cyanothece sp. SIO2G6]
MIFRQSDRPDLVALCSPQLAHVLHRLSHWDQLEQLIHQTYPLHQRYDHTNALAQDYGFLAGIALHRQQWHQAVELSQQALDILAHHNIQSQDCILYLKMLAEAKTALGDIEGAIQHLYTAQAMGVMNHPTLYSEVQWLLQRCLRAQGCYLEAFAIKQEQLMLEKQYGLRAFIGAGQLRDQRPPSVSANVERTIAPEIAVSSRFQDLSELLNRIAGKVHKLIVIHGASGVGKSSLVNGGLIPALQSRALNNRANVPVMMQQYTHWQQELFDTLASVLTQTAEGLALMQVVTDKHQKVDFGAADLPPSLFSDLSLLLTILSKCDDCNLRPVLIFDQFEEFFFVHPDPLAQQDFFQFIADCLELPGALKVVVSLRQDYLHYLLEAQQLVKHNQWPQSSMARSQLDDILSKHILYKIGNLSPEDAKAIIQQLTTGTRMHLESDLVDALVEDLAESLREVRPIELQIVGAQLQTEAIHTLARYNELGNRPKETLVQRYLEDVVVDCGDHETQQLAELVLLLLTDERGTRPLKRRSQLEREFMALLQPESNLFLDVLVNCLTQVPQITKLNGVISKFSGHITQNRRVTHDSAITSTVSHQTQQLEQILYILCQTGVVCYLPDGEGDRYQLVHDYIAEMIRAKKAPQIYQLVADLEQERNQRKRIEHQKRIIEAEKRKLKQANTLLTQAKIKAGRLLLNSLFFSIVISNIFIIIVFLWFHKFAPQKTITLLREDMLYTLKAAANGLDVEELMMLYHNGKPNSEGFSDDPRYTNQLEWFRTFNYIEPRAWLYSFVLTGPAHIKQVQPLSDAEIKQIPIKQMQTIWLVDLWAAYPEYRSERAAKFLYTQKGASSIATIVKYQHKIVEFPGIYEDKWGKIGRAPT